MHEPIVTSLKDWIDHLIQSTSILRSSPTFLLVRLTFLFVCFIVVPWLLFLSALLVKLHAMSLEREVTASLPASGSELDSENTVRARQAMAHSRHLSEPILNSPRQEENDTTDTPLREEDLPPLHFNSLRSPARLRGLSGTQRPLSRSSSQSRSRSSSPVPRGLTPREEPGASITPPGELRSIVQPAPLSRASSERSLNGEIIVSVSITTDKHGHHHLITEDMLTDRLGLEELAPSGTSSPVGGYSTPLLSSPHITLPSVIERMSEESLDDCHAFNDVKLVKKPSFGSDRPSAHGSTAGDDSCNNSVLDTLEEEDFEDEEDDDEKVDKSKVDAARIMFEMLDLLSTAEERRKLEEEKQRKLGNIKDSI